MDNQQILEKAILKAMQNGWREEEFRQDKRYKWPPRSVSLHEDRDYYANSGWWVDLDGMPYGDVQVCQSDDFEDLIFDHDFAKALWGEKEIIVEIKAPYKDTFLNIQYVSPNWKYKLQSMVIDPNPIAYLGENI